MTTFAPADPFTFLADLLERATTPDDVARRAQAFVAGGGEVHVHDNGSLEVQMADGHHVILKVGPAPEISAELVQCLPELDMDPVPHAAIATARRIRAARQRLVESGAYDYKSLAEGRGASVEATRQFVSRAQRKHQIFTVEHNGSVLVPQFLLDETLDPIPDYQEVLAALAPAESSPWAVWNWMVSPSGWLDGTSPADLARSHHALVIEAAMARTATSA